MMNMKHHTVSTGSGISPSIGSEIASDYVGPFAESIDGATGMFVTVELATGFLWVHMVKTKKALVSVIKDVIQELLSYGYKVKKLRFDMGTVENSKATIEEMSRMNIVCDPAGVEAQYQNPAERYIQEVGKNGANLLIAQVHLSQNYWTHSVRFFVNAHNAMPNSKNEASCPLIELKNIYPNLAHHKFEFGQPVVVLKTEAEKQKGTAWDSNAELGFIVQNAVSSNGAVGVIIPCRSYVKVFERIEVKSIIMTEEEMTEIGKFETKKRVVTGRLELDVPFVGNQEVSTEDLEAIKPKKRMKIAEGFDSRRDSYFDTDTENISSRLRSRQAESDKSVDRSIVAMANCMVQIQLDEAITNPKWDKAIKSNYSMQWSKARDEEFENIESMNVRERVKFTDIPYGAVVVATMLLCVLKLLADGTPERFKCRLVELGNLDKTELETVYAPVASWESYMLLLEICVLRKLKMRSYDIKCAFLTAAVTREIYVRVDKNITPSGETEFWKLNKQLYGAKDAPLAFRNEIVKLLESNGYTQSKIQMNFFFRNGPEGSAYFILYVDDIPCGFSTDEARDRLEKVLTDYGYVLKIQKEVKSVLGMEIEREKDGSIIVRCRGRIRKLMADLDISVNENSVNTPMSVNYTDFSLDHSPRANQLKYMEIIGALNHIAKPRPDILFSVSVLAGRSSVCTQRDMDAAIRVVKYLATTIVLGIRFRSECSESHILNVIEVWTDASYGKHIDGKSQSGVLVRSVCGNLLHAHSTKQKNVATSSHEAEGEASFDGGKWAEFYRHCYEELGYELKDPTVMRCDNLAHILVANQFAGNFKRVKHYLIRIAYLMDLIKNKVIKLVFTPGEEMIADILTKPLPYAQFKVLRDQLLGMSLEEMM
jgi:hypothetical protein